MATLNFDARAVEPQAARESTPLPAGTYTVEITGADVRQIKSGAGTGLNVEFTVIDPEQHAKRKVWAFLCIQHSNQQTEQIAQAQLSAICRAVGIDVLTDSDQLFGRILKITTKISPARDGYEPRAEPTGYMAAGAPSAVPAAAPKPSAAAPAGVPWGKKAA